MTPVRNEYRIQSLYICGISSCLLTITGSAFSKRKRDILYWFAINLQVNSKFSCFFSFFFYRFKMGLKIYVCLFLIVVGTTAVFGRGLWPRFDDNPQPRSDLNKRGKCC